MGRRPAPTLSPAAPAPRTRRPGGGALAPPRGVRSDAPSGIPCSHRCLRVDDLCSAEVGSGASFTTPLRLDPQDVQHDGRRGFRIIEDGGLRFVEDAARHDHRRHRPPQRQHQEDENKCDR